jgi:N-acetylmuramoyl-L-alanine amidase-like
MTWLSPFFLIFALIAPLHAETLPFDTVFKGRAKFDALVEKADEWAQQPIGVRTALVGRALAGTPYKGFTLEIHDRIEAPSVNLNGLDCWTFFESSLAFARMLDEPREQWTPATMLRFIELDRYRGGQCDGNYLSRLHYLEEWLRDNDRRGLVSDLTRTLGGERVSHTANEMTINWRTYRYLRANPSLRAGIRSMENRVAALPLYHIPKSRVRAVEPNLHSGDIIGITTRDAGGIGTSHVGLAYRTPDGVLRFLHASAPRNHGRVVLDSRLSDYLNRFRSIAGIIVARPLR